MTACQAIGYCWTCLLAWARAEKYSEGVAAEFFTANVLLITVDGNSVFQCPAIERASGCAFWRYAVSQKSYSSVDSPQLRQNLAALQA